MTASTHRRRRMSACSPLKCCSRTGGAPAIEYRALQKASAFAFEGVFARLSENAECQHRRDQDRAASIPTFPIAGLRMTRLVMLVCRLIEGDRTCSPALLAHEPASELLAEFVRELLAGSQISDRLPRCSPFESFNGASITRRNNVRSLRRGGRRIEDRRLRVERPPVHPRLAMQWRKKKRSWVLSLCSSQFDPWCSVHRVAARATIAVAMAVWGSHNGDREALKSCATTLTDNEQTQVSKRRASTRTAAFFLQGADASFYPPGAPMT